MRRKLARNGGAGALRTALPGKGSPSGSVLSLLRQEASLDVALAEGCSTLSGAVYMSGHEHKRFLDEAYR